MLRPADQIVLITVSLYVILLLQAGVAQHNSEQQKGLIGILYDDTKLTRIRSIWRLEGVDSDNILWQDRNDFSAHWQGYLIAPGNGEFRFFAEADNEIQLLIDGETVIDSWDGREKLNGMAQFTTGQSYRVQLKYSQINGPSYLRLYWQAPGGTKEIIPATALYFKSEDEIKIEKRFRSALRVDLDELEFDISSIIEISNAQDLLKKRQKVIQLLWGSAGFPDQKLPIAIAAGINDSDFVSLSNLKQIDKLTVDMDFGLSSIAYHFIPEQANGQLALYHQGHDGKFAVGIRTIQALLKNGYDVIALSMPLLGMNNRPVVETPRFGKILLHSHNQMQLLQPQQGHPVKYFIEPVAVVVNYALRSDFKRIIMIGISGGGWTTTLAAAIDPRIQISFPVAGTYPHFLRSRDLSHSGSLGDYEQIVPKLYQIANYLELYMMGSFGEGRKQLQILNEFDSCCFRGAGFKTYLEIIQKSVSKLGSGSFDVFLDSTHRLHQISPKALEVIFSELNDN